MTGTWRVIFLGSPEFARPTLTALTLSGEEVVLVVTQPDRPKGRGQKLSPPPVKVLAQEFGLEVWQPESLKTAEAAERFKSLDPHLLVVVAYGRILPPAVLETPRIGPLNLHPSLLPAYRGPAPINWAIIRGETQTGVTTIFMDKGMDTGPILLTKKARIEPEETAGQLHDRLALIGADLVVETISTLKNNSVAPRPQPEDGVSLAPLLKKSDGLIDWTRPADELARLVRGLDPWPGAFTVFRGQHLKVFGAKAGSGRGEPGRILELHQGRLHVAAGRGSLGLAELQLAGKKKQSAADFWRGQRLSPSTGSELVVSPTNELG